MNCRYWKEFNANKWNVKQRILIKRNFVNGAKLALSSTHFRYDMQHLQENWYMVTRKEKSSTSRSKTFWNNRKNLDYKMISTKKLTIIDFSVYPIETSMLFGLWLNK